MSPTTITREDRQWIEHRAQALGFDLAGIAGVPDAQSPEADRDRQRFLEWIEAGRAGDMEWLKRADASGALLRSDLRLAMPWARSVIVCAVNYNADAPRSIDPVNKQTGWIARYAWSGSSLDEPLGADDTAPAADYHDILLPHLRRLEAEVQQRLGKDIQTRCYVDTGPIIERGYAERAGVGWIGKNTCVLNQQQGSWLLLGVIVTSAKLESKALTLPAADRCGSCTRCIDACPTDALLGDRQMDASRCIAYLTIEKKGSIPEDLRAGMGRQVFGCDICQDVCPWNRRAPVPATPMLPARIELVNPALTWLAGMDGMTFNRWFRGSPLERTGRKRVLRNVAVAMGNSGDRCFEPQLKAWAAGDDATLAEAAQWALVKLAK